MHDQNNRAIRSGGIMSAMRYSMQGKDVPIICRYLHLLERVPPLLHDALWLSLGITRHDCPLQHRGREIKPVQDAGCWMAAAGGVRGVGEH